MKKAKEMLDREIAEGVFVQDEQEKCYYLYDFDHEQAEEYRQALLLVYLLMIICIRLSKKHEDTRAEKEQDRIRHVDVYSAQTGPIF